MPDARRSQLAAFLRGKRAALPRADFGLPPLSGQRNIGLRREEVAAFAGVSVTWYTWLEQARSINPSRQVLEALSKTLRLTNTEQTYLLSLGGYSAATEQVQPGNEDHAPPATQRLLDNLPFPAFAVTADWTIAGWNAAYQLLYPRIATLQPGERNLLRLIYTDPLLRDMLPDWATESRHFLAEFRTEAGPRLASPRHSALITRLLEDSEDFRQQWADLAVEPFESRQRTFLHSVAGPLRFEHHRLVPSDHPDLHLVAYVPLDDLTREWFAHNPPPTPL